MKASLVCSAAGVAALVLIAGSAPAGAGPSIGERPSSPTDASAGAAAVATTLGATDPAKSLSCEAGVTVFTSTSAPAASFSVPEPGGVITSFSYDANTTPGNVRVAFFNPTPTAGQWTLAGASGAQPITGPGLATFDVRVPVPTDALLGIHTSANGMNCAGPGVAGDTTHAQLFDPATETTFISDGPIPGYRANVSAVLEPDVDGDGYGDLSQDACPQSVQTHGPCPPPDDCPQSELTQGACPAPDTSLKRRPFVDAKGRTVLKLTSSIAGSTFVCSIDRRAYRACGSPLRKKLGLGKHKILVQAISPFGIPDPTPLKVRIRIAP